MSSKTTALLASSCVAFALLAACSQDDSSGSDPASGGAGRAGGPAAETEVSPRLLRRFQPLKETLEAEGVTVTEEKVQLGAMLFHDPRLSKSGTVSCRSCHHLEAYGADDGSTSVGHSGERGTRNSPTVYNIAAAFAQQWDGRSPSVEEQAKGPIVNPTVMGMPNGAAVVAVLKGIPGYVTAFKAAFPDDADPVTFDNLGRAIGAFERKLVTPGRWDKFLAGDKTALTSAEKEGLKTFLNVGCMVCHTGPLLGASMFERVGVVEPWPNQSDPGRAGVTKAAADRMMFRVPTLRNVERTAPYFHDGSAPTLEAAVKMMGRHQLGLELTVIEVRAIVTWLKSLTGELPKAYIAPPALPPGK